MNILSNNIGEKAAERFIKVILKKDSDMDIAANFGFLRNILENLLEKITELFDVPKSYTQKYKPTGNEKTKEITKLIFNSNDILIQRAFIHWLKDSKQLEGNSLVHSFCLSIYGIGSDFGVHDDFKKRPPPGYKPTTNTVISLVYALKDIILWFGELCKRQKKV